MSIDKEKLAQLSKKELETQIYEKNLTALKEEQGVPSLLIFNLENFAFRYLETSGDTAIKCQFKDDNFWVQSIEPDVINALKWENQELKSELIKLCKQYAGARSKEISVRLLLGTRIIDDKNVECYAEINWNFPNFEKKEGMYLEKHEQVTFDDLMVLRNTHAAYLEKVASIF